MSGLKNGTTENSEDTHSASDNTPRLNGIQHHAADRNSNARLLRDLADKPTDSTNEQTNGVHKNATETAGGTENKAWKVGEKTDDAMDNLGSAVVV